MALPGFYSQTDQDIYAGGDKFIPQERYRLGPYTPPAIMGQNTNAGIVNTQAAGSYMGYPSYEAWLLAQGGGGGGNGGVDEIEEDTFSMGMSPGAMGGKLPGFGNWAKRTLGSLGHAYSKLPTPGNLLMRGIRKWRENREIKKEQKRIAEDRTGIGEHDRGTFTGDHPDAPTKTPEQGGWHPGVGGADSGSAQGSSSPAEPGGWHPGVAEGGRIGFKDGLSAYQLFKLKELGYGNAGSNPGSYGGLGVLRDILKLHKYKDGGRIGYRDGLFVDENIEGPGYDFNEGMEIASAPHPMDALNDFSLEIFNKPYDQLNDEERGILHDLANEQAMGEQDQGIASLV